VLVVDCPRETQLQRLLARDQETPERAEAILAAQATREQRLAVATEVIVNTGTLDELAATVAGLHAQYLEAAATRS
jgi:dephospho-CoA kinase